MNFTYTPSKVDGLMLPVLVLTALIVGGEATGALVVADLSPLAYDALLAAFVAAVFLYGARVGMVFQLWLMQRATRRELGDWRS